LTTPLKNPDSPAIVTLYSPHRVGVLRGSEILRAFFLVALVIVETLGGAFF
jgi:hypothetical protein